MRPWRFSTVLLSIPLIAACLVAGGAGSVFRVIYTFAGDADGEYTDTDLVIDTAGNLYGTSVQGGQHSSGTVFQLSPSSAGWVHTVLYSFTGGLDGGEPYKGVTLDSKGDLYGTAGVGGLYVGPCVDTGCGVVFKLSNINGAWQQSTLHYFTGGEDGYGPGAGVTIDNQGNIYGMTPTGGAYGYGVVYQIRPAAGGGWSESVIHTFTGGVDGLGGSAGRLFFDRGGKLHGVSTAGGAHAAGCVFVLEPTSSGEWMSRTLYSFKGPPDSSFPYGAVLADSKGNLYGTTYYGGASGYGTIFRLSLQNGVWNETWFYSFKGGTDGASPISTLVADATGNLYGTTSEGGTDCNCGTIFKVSLAGAGPVYSVIHRFAGAPGAGFAYNGMAANQTRSTLFGATVHGGPTDDGTIFSVRP